MFERGGGENKSGGDKGRRTEIGNDFDSEASKGHIRSKTITFEEFLLVKMIEKK